MVVNFNNIQKAFCQQCEIEKILRNNVVLWQSYVKIIVNLYSNDLEKAIELLLHGQTDFSEIELLIHSATEKNIISVMLASKNGHNVPMNIRLHFN